MAGAPHRWVIDSIAEHVAAIEVDGAEVVRVPQWILPARAAEGDVLAVRHDVSADGNRSVVTIDIDDAATVAARSASSAQVAGINAVSSDKRGNIKL
jgi:hypothetical protein